MPSAPDCKLLGTEVTSSYSASWEKAGHWAWLAYRRVSLTEMEAITLRFSMYLADREQLVPQPFHRDTSVLGKESKEKEISTARELSIWNYVTNNSKKHPLKGSSVYVASDASGLYFSCLC